MESGIYRNLASGEDIVVFGGRVGIAVSLEKEFGFKEKDAVWQDFFDGRNNPSVRDLCDFVEKRL